MQMSHFCHFTWQQPQRMRKGRELRPPAEAAACTSPCAHSNPWEHTGVRWEGHLSTGDCFPWPEFHPVSPQGLWENHVSGFCMAFLLEKQVGFPPSTSVANRDQPMYYFGLEISIYIFQPKMYISLNALLHLTTCDSFFNLNFGTAYSNVSFVSSNIFVSFGNFIQKW